MASSARILEERFIQLYRARGAGRGSDRQQIELLDQYRAQLERLREQDQYLRQLLALATSVLASLESAIARHDVVAERDLAGRAKLLMSAIDQRIGFISGKGLSVTYSDMRVLLENAVVEEYHDEQLERQRSSRYSLGGIVDRVETVTGAVYVLQRDADRTVAHREQDLDVQPALDETVTIEYGYRGACVTSIHRKREAERGRERTIGGSYV